MVTFPGSPPKTCDIGPHPLQRLDLVEQPIIPRNPIRRLGAELRMRQIAQHADAIVDRNNDHPLARHRRTIIHRRSIVPAAKRAAMNPHDHRRLPRARRPHIESEAVLAHRRRIVRIDAAGNRLALNARRPRPRRVPHALPGPRRHRRLPAFRARIRNPEIRADALGRRPLQLPLRRRHQRRLDMRARARQHKRRHRSRPGQCEPHAVALASFSSRPSARISSTNMNTANA
jgi:hypothetical protein